MSVLCLFVLLFYALPKTATPFQEYTSTSMPDSLSVAAKSHLRVTVTNYRNIVALDREQGINYVEIVILEPQNGLDFSQYPSLHLKVESDNNVVLDESIAEFKLKRQRHIGRIAHVNKGFSGFDQLLISIYDVDDKKKSDEHKINFVIDMILMIR